MADPPTRRVDDARRLQGSLELWEVLVVVTQCLGRWSDVDHDQKPDPTMSPQLVQRWGLEQALDSGFDPGPDTGTSWWSNMLQRTREWLLGRDGEVLLQAVRAAFGPAGDADNDALDVRCQSLATRCWERIPASLHRELRDAILDIPDECWNAHELQRAYPTAVTAYSHTTGTSES